MDLIQPNRRFERYFEALGSDIYSIRDVRQADKYTRTTEDILNYIKDNLNEGNDVNDTLEEFNHFVFSIIKLKTLDSIPPKSSVEEMILGE